MRAGTERTRQRTRRTRRAGRTTALGTAAALLALAGATGCGIRSTNVPVDAGPAPSRASCDTTMDTSGTDGTVLTGGAEVFLVCGTRVEAVSRTVDTAAVGSDRLRMATVLLTELQNDPGGDEQAAGFTSAVPLDLAVSGPVGDDPETVLRLSQRPSELPAFALAQIICTFAGVEGLGNGHAVVLGGPADSPDPRPQTYPCSAAMRHSPESAPSVGRSL
ncbi:hypothetical protein ACFVUW_07570 [Streptomyces xiamenensis]|uniref:hypothetical protein n=1 Tax=Streptomyces xiamenensis TaxID=408015 RepID=UPI0036ED96BE